MQKTGARQYSRGRFHRLLPAVRVTTQGQASEGGGSSGASRGPCGVDPVRRLRLSASTRHERRLARWNDHSTASGALSIFGLARPRQLTAEQARSGERKDDLSECICLVPCLVCPSQVCYCRWRRGPGGPLQQSRGQGKERCPRDCECKRCRPLRPMPTFVCRLACGEGSTTSTTRVVMSS